MNIYQTQNSTKGNIYKNPILMWDSLIAICFVLRSIYVSEFVCENKDEFG